MNKVILMGRLTADPELRYTTGTNIPVCRFRLAVDRPFQKQGEDRQADFFNIVAWRSTAEFVSKFFKKGMRVLIEGYLRNNDYEDNQGVRHYMVEIHAERVYFADSKRDDVSGGFSQPQYGMPAPDDAPVSEPEPGDGFFPLSDDDDDLPF
ncbi:single-stranded DNA-binding protein 2 [Thermoclostridium stercorarium subsp. stercorarium DSM 8532]|jgi:single-strand DNA-binding protein|uniref:Single-stranded DNA-binding protein n=3 Tax=Thermoclostridium stercorarium TaxID=1510 RepID=L7VKB8_THES1|nr:single-stranded DNA-binding protein [Thermoclostridium stercorarium]AGC67157.1 single-stranded DNA-binding protein 2 [Thermoclostridium stercorarium subsp. stercorarium DSM 8532]AGI38234.1 DNA-binding protein [Thermoclostridium stercorarium subsp. stercorarium DSM 8532]ANW97634.1 single-stranded DNA-binding protein [Thermoclostridium stercorarium subsp. thermolacticum DSM 2910]ANX00194.1 single-stranded DNA-binding protein [Thermoclostridium stercorarium subsp. leptospartum DSM 9219]UZQ8575